MFADIFEIILIVIAHQEGQATFGDALQELPGLLPRLRSKGLLESF
jgi:hypothetical protein